MLRVCYRQGGIFETSSWPVSTYTNLGGGGRESTGRVVKAKRISISSDYQHEKLTALQPKLEAKLNKIFSQQKAKILELLNNQKIAKADDSERNNLITRIESLLPETWDDLPDDAIDWLSDSIQAGTDTGFGQLEITDRNLINDVNQIAADWARDRAAEMVGKKWVGNELVDNPNAKWAVSETTRDGIRELVTKAFESPTPITTLTRSIQDAFEFSDSRAQMVASTELKNAAVQGNWLTWKESDQVAEVGWLLSENSKVCGICVALAEESPYPFSTAPQPVLDSHPRCRCSVYVSKLREG